jgi:hypothetical protein
VRYFSAVALKVLLTRSGRSVGEYERRENSLRFQEEDKQEAVASSPLLQSLPPVALEGTFSHITFMLTVMLSCTSGSRIGKMEMKPL